MKLCSMHRTKPQPRKAPLLTVTVKMQGDLLTYRYVHNDGSIHAIRTEGKSNLHGEEPPKSEEVHHRMHSVLVLRS